MSKTTWYVMMSVLLAADLAKALTFAEANPFGFGKAKTSASAQVRHQPPSSSGQTSPVVPKNLARPELTARFTAAGVPLQAVQRVIQYIDQTLQKSVVVTRKNRKTGELENASVVVATRFAAIIDYSLPSDQKRFYLLNLRTGETKKYYVSHGQNSGVKFATVFSNQNNTLKSSLGMVITGSTYSGFHGKSLNLSGLEPSTEAVAERDIVLHGADYASESFIKKHGRLGRSWGCATLDKASALEVMEALGEGSVMYLYHPALAQQMIQNPQHQVLKDPSLQEMPNVVLPGEEQDLQEQRTK